MKLSSLYPPSRWAPDEVVAVVLYLNSYRLRTVVQLFNTIQVDGGIVARTRTSIENSYNLNIYL